MIPNFFIMKITRTRIFIIVTIALAGISANSLPAQDLKQLLGMGQSSSSSPSAALASLSEDQVASGLKEALANGVQMAITNLGRSGGFLNDLAVRIPMPHGLQTVEKTLRALHQSQLADNFVTSMNNAAEQAVPEAASVLGDSIRQMTVADAKAILTATNNAATEYFRRTSETNLEARFLPIVKKATDQVGVTKNYKAMMDKVGTGQLGGFGGLSSLTAAAPAKDAFDVDSYVTRKALDGLFVKIADQEQKIRANPAARTTDLLKQVFGAVSK
jgi:hypothetical protein